jgi:hypothetical protein
VYIIVLVPPVPLAVITTRFDPSVPALILHIMLLSDAQIVDGLALPPVLTFPVRSFIPIFAPIIVTSADPVASLLALDLLLIDSALYEKPTEWVESCTSVVMAIILLLPPEPCPDRHCTLLSENHSVVSHED